MKIKAKDPKAISSCRLIVPFDGLIVIDSAGMVDVSAECAAALVNGTSDWSYAEQALAEEPEQETTAEEEVAEEEPKELTEREKFESELQNMTVTQMKDLCREGGFPEDEWRSLKKATLAAYLLDKFDNASASAAVEEESEEEEEEEL